VQQRPNLENTNRVVYVGLYWLGGFMMGRWTLVPKTKLLSFDDERTPMYSSSDKYKQWSRTAAA